MNGKLKRIAMLTSMARKRFELDYLQGDEVEGFEGTCALTSVANLLTQSGKPTTEGDVVRRAIENKRSAVSVQANARSALCRNYNQWAGNGAPYRVARAGVIVALASLKSRRWRDGGCANVDWRMAA